MYLSCYFIFDQLKCLFFFMITLHFFNLDTVPSIHVGEIITLYFKAIPIKTNPDIGQNQKQQTEKTNATLKEGKKFLSVIHFSHHHYCQSNNTDNTDSNHSVVSDMRNIIQNSDLPQSLINICNDDDMMRLSSTHLEFFCRSGINWHHHSVSIYNLFNFYI